MSERSWDDLGEVLGGLGAVSGILGRSGAKTFFFIGFQNRIGHHDTNVDFISLEKCVNERRGRAPRCIGSVQGRFTLRFKAIIRENYFFCDCSLEKCANERGGRAKVCKRARRTSGSLHGKRSCRRNAGQCNTAPSGRQVASVGVSSAYRGPSNSIFAGGLSRESRGTWQLRQKIIAMQTIAVRK